MNLFDTLQDTTPLVFVVPGEPRGKGRPRARVMGKHATLYTDEKTRAYEKMVASYASRAMGDRKPFECACRMEVVAYIGVTESWTKKKKASALAGELPECGAFDVDNIAKAAMDAINGIAYADDGQVLSLTTHKLYTEGPEKLVVVVHPISPVSVVTDNRHQETAVWLGEHTAKGNVPVHIALMLHDALVFLRANSLSENSAGQSA